MDVKLKQQWSVEEATRFLTQRSLFKLTRGEMATVGYNRSIEQIIDKLKKLTKECRTKRRTPITLLGHLMEARLRFLCYDKSKCLL